MIKSKKKISKKKMMSTRVNILNMWPRSLNQKHYIWKKPQCSIPNQLNVKGRNWRKLQLYKSIQN